MILIAEVLLSKKTKQTLCTDFQIIVNMIVLIVTIIKFKIWRGTQKSKRTSLLP